MGKLTKKITLLISITWIGSFLVFSLMDYFLLKRFSYSQFQVFLEDKAADITNVLRSIPIDILPSYFAKMRSGNKDLLLVVSQDGVVITANRDFSPGEKPELVKKGNLWVLKSKKGEVLAGTRAPLSKGKWLYIFEPQKLMLSPTGYLFPRSLILIAFTIGVMLLLLDFLVQRDIIAPLKVILKANRSVIDGNYADAVIPSNKIPDNELGEFIRVRNEMLWKLLNQKKELEKLQKRLEEKVKQRTHDLERERNRLDVLHRASYLLIMSRSKEEVLNNISNLFQELLKPQATGIYSEHGEGGILLLTSCSGKKQLLPKFVIVKHHNYIREFSDEDGVEILILTAFSKANPVFAFSFALRDKVDQGTKEMLLTILRETSTRLESLILFDELRESEDVYRSLFKNALVAHYIIQNGRFVMVNNAFLKIFGYREEEVYKKGPLDLTHPDDRDRVIKYIKLRLQGKIEHIKYRFRGLTKGGEARFIEVLGSRIMYRGRPAIQGTLLDITDTVKALEREKKTLTQITILHEIIAESFTELQRNKIAQKVAYLLQEKLGYHVAQVGLINRNKDTIDFVGMAGKLSEKIEETVSLPLVPGQGLTVTSVLEGRTIYVPDVSLDPRYKRVIEETQSELCTPIIGSSGILGVINLERPEKDAFDEADILSIETLAAGLAKILEAAELYQSVKRQAERLSNLSDLIAKLYLQLEPKKILSLTGKGLKEIVEADTLVMGKQEDGFLHILNCWGDGANKLRGKRLMSKNQVGQFKAEEKISWDLSPIMKDSLPSEDRILLKELEVHGSKLYFIALRNRDKTPFSEEIGRIADIFLTQAQIAIINGEDFEELRCSEKFYRELFDVIDIGVVVADKKGIIKRVNRAAATLLGEDQKDLIGKKLKSIMGRKTDLSTSCIKLREGDVLLLDLHEKLTSSIIVKKES
jgi:PAS domain S-box-containing protein